MLALVVEGRARERRAHGAASASPLLTVTEGRSTRLKPCFKAQLSNIQKFQSLNTQLANTTLVFPRDKDSPKAGKLPLVGVGMCNLSYERLPHYTYMS